MTRRWRKALVGLAFLGQAFIIATTLIPNFRALWHFVDQAHYFSVLAAALTIDVLLVTVIVWTYLNDIEEKVSSTLRDLDRRSPQTIVERVREDSFYEQFLAAAQTAKSTVRISYFAPTPPTAIPSPQRSEYYSDIQLAMKKRTAVRFKRLVRDTPANGPWIAQLLRDCQQLANVDIAVVTEDMPEDAAMPLALSVQVVDNAEAWLVALNSHERDGEWRDLYVRDGPFAEAMTVYHNRLWSHATALLASGVLTNEGRAHVEAHPTA